ncbi:acyl-CoA dehydrogenase family protein [Paeniglutamicibacter sp. MACA_103]|uniref:acyl-CoA dehydrogenase family protein n=1 Tax=Paeniglutamicibacter sp. MACA_103 TaxID=3377337 RepID=UPI003893CE0E
MTITLKASEIVAADYATQHARFADLFSRIADGSRLRDLERILPFEQVAWLDEAGFGALRVPVESGGAGVSVETFARLLIDLAAADSNVAHLYRSHFGFVESLQWQDEAIRRRWYERVAAGKTVGNASTELGGNALGHLNTVLAHEDGTWVLNGEKFYTTGTIFSDYTRVSAALEGKPGRVFALVDTKAAGVEISDDWDGFGQRLTGTGTTRFDDVRVEAVDLFGREAGGAEATHEAAFFQLVLLGVLAGIARAARNDAAQSVAKRARTFNTGSGLPFRDDPLIQETVGRIATKAFTAEATVLAAARTLDTALQTGLAQEPDESGHRPTTTEGHLAELAVEQAQVSVPELAIGAAQQLFETGGASATSTSKGLDRHWRNAQTVATHNPIAFRARSIGDYFINGTLPEGLNAIGNATAAPAAT